MVSIFFYKLRSNIDTISVFIFSCVLFYFIIDILSTDIEEHVKQIQKINMNSATYPPNLLFYFLVNLVSGFSNNIHVLLGSSVLVLSTAMALKYSVSKYIISDYFSIFKISIHPSTLSFVCVSLLFIFPFPDFYFGIDKWYITKIPPNVWHNSTTIMVFPFAILLFWKQYKFMVNPLGKDIKKNLFILSILVLLNVLIKPSFLFVFIPVTGFFVLLTNWNNGLKTMIIKAFPALIAVFFVGITYFLIYKFQAGSFQTGKSQVKFDEPFAFYSLIMPLWFFPISIILSYIFPLLTYFLFIDFRKDKLTKYLVGMILLGWFISVFVYESGPRKNHGNFIWQNVITTYLFYLIAVAFILKKHITYSENTLIYKVLQTILSLSVVSGILYLIKTFITKNYF